MYLPKHASAAWDQSSLGVYLSKHCWWCLVQMHSVSCHTMCMQRKAPEVPHLHVV